MRHGPVGVSEAEQALGEGAAVLIAGEMGIGNTTPAACLTALLTGLDPDAAVGRGAGADDAALAAKRRVAAEATGRASAAPRDRSTRCDCIGLRL